MSGGGAHLADAEEPLDVAPVRSGRSSCSSWLMAPGMASSHRGFAGTAQVPQRQVAAAVPAGRGVDGFARATSPRTSTRCTTRLWLRLTGWASVSTSGPAAAVPGRLEPSVSTTLGGAAAASPTATTPAAQLGRPRRHGELVDVGR